MKKVEPNVTIEMDLRERRLYDRLRAAIVAPQPGRRSGMRDMLLLLPDLTVLLMRLFADDARADRRQGDRGDRDRLRALADRPPARASCSARSVWSTISSSSPPRWRA